ncbi:unnamed protein product [Arabis nemorensis]|uniref:Uncharacterized protein n=1 Tax=Arabis nemorensis TaxID=586526 RepID=A0A565BH78_9BRAS|nr:unnamed protein product [Arabis nemorensis]
MVNLELELNLNSASDLEIVNHVTKMDVYVVITLHGHKTLKKHKEKTAVDHSGGRLGITPFRLLDLLRSYTPSTNGNGDGMRFVTYPVRTPSETMKGCLSFSYRFNGSLVNSAQAYYEMPTGAPPSQYGVWTVWSYGGAAACIR